MQLCGALILFTTLSTACGLRCFVCGPTDPQPCKNIQACPDFTHCFSSNILGIVAKGCVPSTTCVSPIDCCVGNLCNNAIPTGPSVILLLVSSAIINLFL